MQRKITIEITAEETDDNYPFRVSFDVYAKEDHDLDALYRAVRDAAIEALK